MLLELRGETHHSGDSVYVVLVLQAAESAFYEQVGGAKEWCRELLGVVYLREGRLREDLVLVQIVEYADFFL